ncbi:MAG: DUF3467 domain-containing protein [Phycisphaerae bacterium]|nr:DUF3467 domain-containing protein [Phycisphaerae bacterium]
MIYGEDDSQPQQPQQQRVRFDTSKMESVYANFVALAGSADEVVLYVGANTPMPGQQEPVVSLSHRVIMMPPNAKRLMLALQQTMKAHEDRFGPIEIPPPPRPHQS